MFRIKEIIESKNETVKNIAGKLGIAPPNLSNIINGRVAPSIDLLQRIADALDVHISELFERPEGLKKDKSRHVFKCPHCNALLEVSELK